MSGQEIDAVGPEMPWQPEQTAPNNNRRQRRPDKEQGMDEKNGGAAFPQNFQYEGPATDPISGQLVPAGEKVGHIFMGMTLRDYFAAKAMAQVYAASAQEFARSRMDAGKYLAQVADGAYALADAMLAERAK